MGASPAPPRHPPLRAARRPPLRQRLRALAASLLIDGTAAAWPLQHAAGAERLEMRLEGLQVPIALDQLEAWQRQAGIGESVQNDLGPWLTLLDPAGRQELRRLLAAPLLRERSFGRQLLDTWAGGQLLGELGGLLTTPDGRSSSALLRQTLQRQLELRGEVSLLELLRAMPVPQLNLELDGLISLAERWRQQLIRQQRAFRALQDLPLPAATAPPPPAAPPPALPPQRLELAVAGRQEPLPLWIWSPPARRQEGPERPWVLMMPGLGGDAQQLGWLAAALAARGWPVVVLQHPGSDGQAVRSALAGQRRPPGAESLSRRLADAEAVLRAQRQGLLPLRGSGLVLAGHSLGGVTALLAAGVRPERGLDYRCRHALERLPLSNPSRLLQCELVSTGLPTALRRPADLRGLLLFNSFGSLLWPDGAAATLPVPVLMAGGSLDLVTPPLDEQLSQFLPAGNAASRLVLLEGGSHFSPLRLEGQGEALLQLGRDLVGVDPAVAQSLLLEISVAFLEGLDAPRPEASRSLPVQVRRQQTLRAFVLDPPAARRWRERGAL